MTRFRLGLDLGGTKLESIALGPGGAELFRTRIPAPQGDYGATLDAIAGVVRDADARLGEEARVGIGMPGAIIPATGLVKNANSVWLNGRPFGRDITERLGREVRIANDADCFALSEAVDGAGQGARTVFGVILGTGVGGGIVVNGTLLSGPNAIAGEWGHNPLPRMRDDERPGPACYCGKKGCIETFLSGPGLKADHARRTGEDVSTEEIAARSEAGDSVARHSLALYVERLARALGSVVNILDPDVIVLGGGLSNIDALYPQLRETLPHHVFSDVVVTRIAKNRHGDASGVRGAAWLWAEGE